MEAITWLRSHLDAEVLNQVLVTESLDLLLSCGIFVEDVGCTNLVKLSSLLIEPPSHWRNEHEAHKDGRSEVVGVLCVDGGSSSCDCCHCNVVVKISGTSVGFVMVSEPIVNQVVGESDGATNESTFTKSVFH